MIVRRIAAPLAPLLVLASLPLVFGVGPATASDDAVIDPVEVAAPALPLARGDDGDGDGMTAKQKEKPNPCPEELWMIPLQVEGLACVLLLPKKEEAADKDKET